MPIFHKCAVIIQARMSSNRFPGKMMAFLAGMPLVEYVYRRCKKSTIKDVLVATSDNKSDDILADHCIRNGIPVMRGSLGDVLARYISSAESMYAEYVARVCGDTPFVDIGLMDKMMNMLIKEKLEYIGFNKQACASCFYSETVTLKALNKIRSLTRSSADLEHVTKFIIDNPDRFLARSIDAGLNPEFIRKITLTIDQPEDMRLANAVVNELPDSIFFDSEDILSIVKRMKEKHDGR